MNNKVKTIFFISIIFVFMVFYFNWRGLNKHEKSPEPPLALTSSEPPVDTPFDTPTETPNDILDEISPSPLYIESLRARDYPASEIIIEETIDKIESFTPTFVTV